MAKHWMVAVMCLIGVTLAIAQDKGPAKEKAKVTEKWEYAELHSSAALNRGIAVRVAPGGGNAPAPVPRRAAKTTVQWITGDKETEADSWADLATKLKAPAAAKDATPAAHKVKLLNSLGTEGWELVSSTPTVMTFKRKAK